MTRRFDAIIIGSGQAEPHLADRLDAKTPYTVIQRAVHIHPTVSELIPTMLDELRPLEM